MIDGVLALGVVAAPQLRHQSLMKTLREASSPTHPRPRFEEMQEGTKNHPVLLQQAPTPNQPTFLTMGLTTFPTSPKVFNVY